MDITYTEATEEHVKEIVNLHNKVFRATYPTFPIIHTREEDIQHFTDVIGAESVHVALYEGKVVGYLALSGEWLNKLYVDPDFQGHGVGTKLLEIAKDSSDMLQLWTFQVNQKAREFYERHGFVKIKETDGSENEERQPDVLYGWQKKLE